MNDKQTKMERYQEMQAMVQKEIEKMFPKLYSQEATNYGVAATPCHQHNGLDSPQISQDNVILTNKLITQLVSDESEEFTLLNVSNVSRISFHGFAFDSSSSPATKKAVAAASARAGGSGEAPARRGRGRDRRSNGTRPSPRR